MDEQAAKDVMKSQSQSASAGRELRIGLIGAGKMALNHLRAIRGCAGARVVGIADPAADASMLESLLPTEARIYASAEQLLAETSPDIVHVVTPPHTHVELARMALAAGAHVYVEKPFTLHRRDAEDLLALARERGLLVCPGHQCLFDTASLAAQQALPELGTIVHVESYFSFRTARASISPVDQAIDILPHAVYMLLPFLRAADRGAAEPLSLRGLDVGPDGDIYGIVGLGECRGLLTVTLRGRPVQQYVHVVGTNGCMRVDLVTGAVVKLGGPGANAVSAVTNPYRQASQTVRRSTTGLVHHVRERKFGYPGMRALLEAFYQAVRSGGAAPIADRSIVDTVAICEEIGVALRDREARQERAAETHLARVAGAMAPAEASRGVVLVTGAGGFLGRAVVGAIRANGRHVRALTRRPPRFAVREPGVEYRDCDLAAGIPMAYLDGVSTVVHLAAETKGGKAAHERNSIKASEQVLAATAAAGVTQLVHISSVAVLRPSASASTPLDESSPIDGALARGPYVWGKAESEQLIEQGAKQRGIGLRIIRLGPLVDYGAFQAPGRLGRELGPVFVAVGPRVSRIALIDVARAGTVIATAVEDFDQTPALLNLVEPEAPTREDLVSRLVSTRPDLRVVWLPMWVLKAANPVLKGLQRLVLRSAQPLDVAGAFGSPQYRTELSADMLRRSERIESRRAQAAPVEQSQAHAEPVERSAAHTAPVETMAASAPPAQNR